MLSIAETEKEARSLRSRSGYGNWDFVVAKLARERIPVDRPKRIKFPPTMYQRLFDDQGGMCPECQEHLDVPAKKNEIDHINPHEEKFNERFNLQLLHSSCNREKSAMTVLEQSKSSGETMETILSRK